MYISILLYMYKKTFSTSIFQEASLLRVGFWTWHTMTQFFCPMSHDKLFNFNYYHFLITGVKLSMSNVMYLSVLRTHKTVSSRPSDSIVTFNYYNFLKLSQESMYVSKLHNCKQFHTKLATQLAARRWKYPQVSLTMCANSS